MKATNGGITVWLTWRSQMGARLAGSSAMDRGVRCTVVMRLRTESNGTGHGRERGFEVILSDTGAGRAATTSVFLWDRRPRIAAGLLLVGRQHGVVNQMPAIGSIVQGWLRRAGMLPVGTSANSVSALRLRQFS
ncbi:hypothetical protein [Candidatus Amarolinea dominans]|uniref:hypothetical protein n=1 Tax=Candidatus Amarolinea dominans TaxID=3140696 RepID=UPI003136A511|nr:hypothetical protein [Anaerolineae bacterium]